MPITLVPLYTLRGQLRPPTTIHGAAGTRMIFEVDSVEIVDDGFRGHLLGTVAADWFVIGPDATGAFDVRATFEMDGGVAIHLQAPAGSASATPTPGRRASSFAPRTSSRTVSRLTRRDGSRPTSA